MAELRTMEIPIEDVPLDNGLHRAMESYEHFLTETPQSKLAPEAIRRLADLKIEKEYGHLTATDQEIPEPIKTKKDLPDHQASAIAGLAPVKLPDQSERPVETESEFEKRATGTTETPDLYQPGPNDLERKGPLEAIALYEQLLEKYPLYDRNDQVLYQMSRAYEELGRVEDAMHVMNRIAKEYPHSRYIDEIHFRRAEYYFTRRQYFDAEEAYGEIVNIGQGSAFYPFALYKMGWTFYKQELYEEALDKFIALLDYKVAVGYDFEQTEDEPERKRIDDTFRAISLSFSYLGGADIVVEYFIVHGPRSYENLVYSNLGEYYYDKRRYSDANASYSAFVDRNPYHEKSPYFQMRIIEINIAGGFPSLVIESKKTFAKDYGLRSAYWEYFDPQTRPDVLELLKNNLNDLATHYHALYQDPEFKEERSVHFDEAQAWYREYLASFPADEAAPSINYQLADLLLENNNFEAAAIEYEKTAYDYAVHDKSSTAGYAAVFSYRQHLKRISEEGQLVVKYDVVRSSVRFAKTFPEHEKAAVVQGAAVDDLYDMQEYQQALDNARDLVDRFPGADHEILNSAWIVIGHSSYELDAFAESESAYTTVLERLSGDDLRRTSLMDNLAASIYEQGAQAQQDADLRQAADHYLRISSMAPTSSIRPTAEFDAAAALIQLQDWGEAALVLNGFRRNFPGHAMQPDVTKKLAFVYREDGLLYDAAQEYERIEVESNDEAVRSEALLTAAELYLSSDHDHEALVIYRRYIDYFPRPLEMNVETRHKISTILLAQGDQSAYLQELEEMVQVEDSDQSSQTPRTRYLASKAGLVLAERSYADFTKVRLVNPIETTLLQKQELMKKSTDQFKRLLEYEVADVTSASTYYLAEIYAHFSQALMESERPEGLSSLELEEYELAIEDQAYPFEEKAIEVHESNLALLRIGVFNDWVKKSLRQLAQFVPARYDRPDMDSPVITSVEAYVYGTQPIEAPLEPSGPDAPQSNVAQLQTDSHPADQDKLESSVQERSRLPDTEMDLLQFTPGETEKFNGQPESESLEELFESEAESREELSRAL
jgi:outer membrane protein assembly factor BamD (BamD/ComL family)